ncbi:MAG: HAMP domain-containing protein [Oscillospiraceae bacterium]|nr:HAMP domain-containing protein [Oscillospiraceae bacterium]
MGRIKRKRKEVWRATSLRKRWLTNTMFVVVPIALVCVAAVMVAFSTYYYSGMRSDMTYRAETTADFFAGYMNVEYGEYYQSCIRYAQTYEDRTDLELQFIDADGDLVASSYGVLAGEKPQTEEIREAMLIRTARSFVGPDPVTGERIMAVSTPLIYSNGEVIGVLRFVTSTRIMDLQITKLTLAAMGFCAFFVLAVLLTTNYYIHSILQPIAEITVKAQRIAAGSYGTQIKTRYNDEIGALADTINDLSNQVSQNERMQTDFISSLSHELRTPLTAITGWGETLLSCEQMDPEDTRRGMNIILREARRLTEMVVDLLDFTKMQDGRFTLNVEPTDIQAEFEDTIFMYGSRLKQDGTYIHYEDSDQIIPEISCDPKRLRQVFLNILDNAAKHGGGKNINASISSDDNFVEINIRDFGPGIPEDELPLVKKKFYKGSSKARGSGIGLAVCDEIVALHGGELSLRNAGGGGTIVTIKLPINQ